MNDSDPANRASLFLLGNQLQRILRQGESQPARRAELLEGLLQIEREDAAAATQVPAGQAPTPSPAPMYETPGGIKLHGR